MADPPESNAQSDVASELCTACGLCCSGAFFYRVVVTAAESLRLAELSVPTHTYRANEFRMLEPCSALVDCTCTIYNHRPQDCRDFDCRLLSAALSQAVSIDRALEIIGTAKSLIASLTPKISSALPANQQESNNVYVLLSRLFHHVNGSVNKQGAGSITIQQRHLLAKACDYLSLIAKHFRSPSLLAKYRALIATIDAANSGCRLTAGSPSPVTTPASVQSEPTPGGKGDLPPGELRAASQQRGKN
ncbi:YkgJ family cysteine cluster protein [Synechococcus sp. CS-1328]|uniref:YkgJ family cysteine cluster protein n=1 Tax=Synechococcus sp. CS-1328 TaxID=2847976 RepID=UPI00223ACFA6|nr:YkgJ family cysteine cluster protein [Synechococcus sp. CS-1328]MCT0224779.1 YkgJ family cysteine cluster protein [Synechococcus sp. CS-1328]